MLGDKLKFTKMDSASNYDPMKHWTWSLENQALLRTEVRFFLCQLHDKITMVIMAAAVEHIVLGKGYVLVLFWPFMELWPSEAICQFPHPFHQESQWYYQLALFISFCGWHSLPLPSSCFSQHHHNHQSSSRCGSSTSTGENMLIIVDKKSSSDSLSLSFPGS